MKIIFEFYIILLFTVLGELIAYLLPFNFPGSVIGLLLLFIALITGIVKSHHIKNVSDFLQKNMAILFVPLTVGIMEHFNIIKINYLQIILILFVSTTLTLLVTAIIGKRGVRDE